MPDGSNAPTTLTGLVAVDMDDNGCNQRVPATADAILISMCLSAQDTAERIQRAANGEVVHQRETPAASHQRLSTARDYLLADIAYTPASTQEGLQAKAKAACLFGDNRILWSVLEDLCGREGAPPLSPELTASPVASADELFDRYDSWLFYERRSLLMERHGANNLKTVERFVPADRHVAPRISDQKPTARAAAVLSAAGIFTGPANHLSPVQIAQQMSTAPLND